MKFSRLLALAILLTTSSGCYKSSSIKVILLAGQSNMEGHDSRWDELPEETIKAYRQGHDNVKIDYNCTYEKTYEEGVANTSNGEFVDVDFGQGRNEDLFGPEVGAAAYLGKHSPNQKYYFIKSCEGSSYLAEQWAEDGSCYKTFVNDVNLAIKKMKKQFSNFKIVALMWMQGEFDACEEKYANQYKTNTFDLIDRINLAFEPYIPNDGISFIDAGIFADASSWQYYEKVNTAKKEVVASNKSYRYVKDSETLERHPKRAHYSAKSYLKLGERFAEEYLDIK